MRFIFIAACVALAGCAGNLKLLEDGKVHNGQYNSLTKQVDVDIDGRHYSGSFFQGAAVGFGTSFSGGRVSTGTGFGSNGSGGAVLTSSDGKVLECGFQAMFGRGQGHCAGMDGRQYVLVIGG